MHLLQMLVNISHFLATQIFLRTPWDLLCFFTCCVIAAIVVLPAHSTWLADAPNFDETLQSYSKPISSYRNVFVVFWNISTSLIMFWRSSGAFLMSLSAFSR